MHVIMEFLSFPRETRYSYRTEAQAAFQVISH